MESVHAVESAAVHYAPTSVDFLRNLRAQDEAGAGEQYMSAILLEEKSVWDYNQGNPSGDPLTLGDEAPPATQLVAFYPSEGALIADHPYVTLQADWVTDDDRGKGPTQFLGSSSPPTSRSGSGRWGSGTTTGAPGRRSTRTTACSRRRPVTITPPGGDVLTQIRNDWPDFRKRARLLIVMDVSASMAARSPGTGATENWTSPRGRRGSARAAGRPTTRSASGRSRPDSADGPVTSRTCRSVGSRRTGTS